MYQSKPTRLKVPITIAFATHTTVASATLVPINGILKQIAVKCPAMTAGVNTVLTILDDDGDTLYTSGNNASAATTVTTSLATALVGKHTLTLTAAGAQDADKACVVKLYVATNL